MSLQDFHNFLKKEHSEENIEFYTALQEYKRLCLEIPSEVLKHSESSPPNEAIALSLKAVKAKLEDMLKIFFNEESQYDLNVPIRLKKPFFHEINVVKNIHPDVFDGILENVLTMLKLSSFPNFMKEAQKVQVAINEVSMASLNRPASANPALPPKVVTVADPMTPSLSTVGS
ncbi:hypothetical protein BCR33DRAFT_476399 [Rhizoclosmatium globosum]|uniref:RGS domain-containing protein n=1 Tax=Rhizoclosmatium globosum TaxID=329046 RepID=A0A1Y2BNV0_9FUNG|nr:hypothetical protein BCR33DRAFT_476399 [Rhizoclosmatium globosum]|eukprot:ORY36430.1 hypothetical protein BCR33DRAFT_476399 [Rhizoclosmatium globosum]